jgi:hypothetical protein
MSNYLRGVWIGQMTRQWIQLPANINQHRVLQEVLTTDEYILYAILAFVCVCTAGKLADNHPK